MNIHMNLPKPQCPQPRPRLPLQTREADLRSLPQLSY